MSSRARDAVQRFPSAALGLAAVLAAAAWFVFLPSDSSVSSDDGAYALHVLGLEEGGWSVPHALADVDRRGLTYPYQNSSITEEGWFPGARHATWVRVLAVGHALGGSFGMHAASFVWLGVAVAATGVLGRRIAGGGTAFLAPLLLATSPLLFNSLQLWGHTAVVAALAVSFVGSAGLLDSGRARPLDAFACVGGAAAASALRGDGLVFALALAVSLGSVGMWQRRWRVVGAAAAAGGAALGGYRLSSRYAASVLGQARSDAVSTATSGESETRWDALVQTFFSANDAPAPFLLLFVATALTGTAVWRLRQRDGTAAAVLLALASGVWFVRTLAFPDEAATGLIGAWPVVVFALARPWRSFTTGERWVVLTLLVAAGGIALTQYDGGGGLNWGGRYYASALPGLCVLAAGGLRSSFGRVQRSVPLACAAVTLVVATAGSSLVFDATLRLRHDEIVDRLDPHPGVPVVTATPPLPRLSWRTYPEVQWLMVPGDDRVGDASDLRALLLDSGVDEVILFGVPRRTAETITGGPLRAESTSQPVRVRIR